MRITATFQVRVGIHASVEHQRQGRLPPRSLVITFDDGYADNAEVALPILRRHGLAADFFISTGFLDGGRMWNDTVIESLRRSTCKFIDLDEFGLGRMPLSSHAERRQAIDRILPRLKYLALQERDAAVVRVQRLAGDPALPNDLMMRTEHVRELHKAGMEIGGHTVRHPILCALPDGEAEAEIAAGKAQLESVIDTSVDVMAYPNGEPGRDYDGRHVALSSDSVDLIMSRSVFEHLVEPQAVYAEFARVLRVGGKAIVLTANMWDYGTLAARLVPNRFHGRVVKVVEGRAEEDTFPTAYRTNTRRDVSRLAQGAGLNVVSFEYLSQYPNYLLFNGAIFFVGMCFEKLIARFDVLAFLRGWILVTLEKRERTAA